MRKTCISLSLILLAAASAAWAGSHETTKAAAADDGRSARVAGGQIITLVDSAKSPEQWAEERPDYQALRPGQQR